MKLAGLLTIAGLSGFVAMDLDGKQLRSRRILSLLQDGDPPANTTATNGTHSEIIHKSALHESLKFPTAIKVPMRKLNSTEFIEKYCESRMDSRFTVPPPVGTAGQRYEKAILEQLGLLKARKAMMSSSLAQLAPKSSVESLYGVCSTDGDCTPLGRRKYCVEGSCRECTSATRHTDCPHSPTDDMCSASTGYTCSECLSDDQCDEVGGRCRFMFPDIVAIPMMPRKVCTDCSGVPETAEIYNATSCAWRCPHGTTFDSSEMECVAIEKCTNKQFLAPKDDLSAFFSPGINSTDAVCRDCESLGPVEAPKFCAVIGTSTGEKSPIGDINTGKNMSDTLPCSKFTCKAGWTLNGEKSKCTACNYGQCNSGTFLQGCGGDQKGWCADCQNSLLRENMTWVDLSRVDLEVSEPQITCLTVCKAGFFRNSPSGDCQSCTEAATHLCGPGETLEECGPGTNAGRCKGCPNLTEGSFWTGHKCQEERCNARESKCSPGNHLVGCGGRNPGECTRCTGGLPTDAIAWTQNCEFMCQPNFFQPTDGSQKCMRCDDSVQCPVGKTLKDCGKNGKEPGSCVACPPIGTGLFFTGRSGCKSARCDTTICEKDERLVDCGYGNPGKCVSCGPLPRGVHRFKKFVNAGSVRECLPACKSGFELIKDPAMPAGVTCQRTEDDDSDDSADEDSE